MHISNLLASNIVGNGNCQSTEIARLLACTPNLMQGMMDDLSFTQALLTPIGFLSGNTGNFEAFIGSMLQQIIQQESAKQKGSYTGYLPDMAQIFSAMPDALAFNKIFVEQAKMRMGTLNNWKVESGKFAELSNANCCAVQTFEYLNRAVALYFVKKEAKDGVKRTRTLVTRNVELIRQLSNLGMIQWSAKQTLFDLQKKIWDASNAAAFFKEGKAWAIHIRYAKTTMGADGRRIPVFEVTTSTGRIPMMTSVVEDKKKDIKTSTMLTPLSTVYAEEIILKQLLSTGAFKVVKQSDDGTHERIITSNPDVVIAAFDDVPKESLQKQLEQLYDKQTVAQCRNLFAKTFTGFDLCTMRHWFTDLQSSITARMVWGVAPGAWQTITPVPLDKLNKAYHNVDFYLVSQIFTSRVLNARKADFNSLPADIELANFNLLREKQETLLKYGASLNNYDLFDFMIANAQFFGDMATQLATRARNRLHYLKNFKPIDIQGKMPEEIAEELKKALAAGVVRLTFLSATRGRYEVMGTTNTQILKKEYGEDYIYKFGSPRDRLRGLAEMIKSGTPITKEFYAECGVDAKLPVDFLSMSDKDKLAAIDAIIAELQQRDFAIVPGTISFKVADSSGVVDKGVVTIYRTNNVANLVAAAYSPK